MNDIDTVFFLQEVDLQESKSFVNSVVSPPFEDRPHLLSGFDWFFTVSLVLLFMLAIIKLNIVKTFKVLKRKIRGKQIVNTYSSDYSYGYFPLFPFIVCICIVFTLALYMLFYQSDANKDYMLFLRSFAIIVSFIVGRLMLLRFVGFLFKIKNLISEFEQITTLLFFTTAILCFPFIFIGFYYYFSLLGIITLLAFALIFLLRIVQGWTIFRKKMKIHEYFLYFCTIEILPLLVFFKFVTNRLLVI